MSQIPDLVRKLSGHQKEELYALMGTVSEVDEQALTCTVTPLNDKAPVMNVPLQGVVVAGGWVLIPKDGSKVLIVFTGKKFASVVATPEVEKALLYGERTEIGGADGEPLVLGETLNATLGKYLDELNAALAALQQFASTQAAASVGTLAPLAAGFTALVTSMAQAQTKVEAIRPELPEHLSETVTTI